jgi:hypothetical protein
MAPKAATSSAHRGRALMLRSQRGSHLWLLDDKTNPFLSPLAMEAVHNRLATAASYGCCSAMMRGRCEASDPKTGRWAAVDPRAAPMGVESAQSSVAAGWRRGAVVSVWWARVKEIGEDLGLSRLCGSRSLTHMCVGFCWGLGMVFALVRIGDKILLDSPPILSACTRGNVQGGH